MRTRKPISTISYNSSSFLTFKLEELRKAKIITLWFYITHQPEEDEKKEHKHLFIIPAKQIQTDELKDEFIEYDPNHPEKPLKCLHFVNSVFSDWFLYSVHDIDYLLKKGQTRKYHYKIEDFVCSDRDELDFMIGEIDLTSDTAFKSMISAIEEGITWLEYIKRGCVPPQQFKNFEAAWFTLTEGKVSRNGRTSHTPVTIDQDTGEVIEN